MGTDKALVEVAGRAMGESVVAALRSVADEVVVVGRARRIFDARAIPDARGEYLGPLSGIVTALEALEMPFVAVAVDQPLVRTETLERLFEYAGSERTAVCIDELPQVTCAAYTPSLLATAADHLERGGSVRTVLADSEHAAISEVTWREWGEDGRSWFSMDSPDDIVEAERRFRLDLLG